MYNTILLPVDTNARDSQAKACETASRIVNALGAKLHVMTVVPTSACRSSPPISRRTSKRRPSRRARLALEHFITEALPDVPVTEAVVGHGSIYQEILRVAGEVEADLIVMASHRPELQDYLIGPNAARVVRHAGCSVMVVRD